MTTTTGTTTGSAASTVVPTTPGSTLRLRGRPLQTSSNADTYTISTSVDRTGVRAALTTSG